MKDIMVCIPVAKLAEVEAEEKDVARREAAGETGISYFWQMGRLPKETPRRIYFVWDGHIRAYHEVLDMDKLGGRIYMKTKICSIDPVPQDAFRGFRYMK